jgi:choline-phosphate cytidylyltransferase
MTIVYADMVCDIFHIGHVNFLKKLSNMGDTVIIGVNSDTDTQVYKRLPIIPLDQRASVLASCRYVDKVISPCPLVITEKFMNKHNIDIVVHAHDEGDTSYDFIYGVPIKLGKFQRFDYTKGISTTDIIKRCLKVGKSKMEK